MSVYVETSAAAKILVTEAESPALASYLDDLEQGGTSLVSGVLTDTELRRVATRNALSQNMVSDVLAHLDIADPDRAVFTQAGLLPGANLRSLDAVHIAVAIRAHADAMVTYDARQATAARGAGLSVISPGTD